MPIERTDRRLYLFPETNALFGTDFLDGDGSELIPVDTHELGMFQDGVEVIEFNIQTGRARNTRKIIGAEGCTLSFSLAFKGLAEAHGAGETPAIVPPLNARALLFENAIGTIGATLGREAEILADVATVEFTGTAPGVQDLLAIHENNLVNNYRTYWARAGISAGLVTTVDPPMIAPGAALTSWGTQFFTRPESATFIGGNPLTAVMLVGGQTKVARGGRVVNMQIELTAKQIVVIKVTMNFVTRAATEVLADIPNFIPEVVPAEIIGRNCEF